MILKFIIVSIYYCYQISMSDDKIFCKDFNNEFNNKTIDEQKQIIDSISDFYYDIKHGKTLVHYICKYSTLEIVQYLFDRDIYLGCKSDEGLMPIHYVCENPYLDVVKYVISYYDNINIETDAGTCPIHYMCINNNFEGLKYIIEKKMQIFITHLEQYINLFIIFVNI